MRSLPKHSNPQRQERPTGATRIINNKVVGTSPVRSGLCTLYLALATAVGHTDTKAAPRVRERTVGT